MRYFVVLAVLAAGLLAPAPAQACWWWRHCCRSSSYNGQGYSSGYGYSSGGATSPSGWGFSGTSGDTYGINPLVQNVLLDLLRRNLSNLPITPGPGPGPAPVATDLSGVTQQLAAIQGTLVQTNQKLDTIAQRLSKYQLPPDRPQIDIPDPPAANPVVPAPVTPAPINPAPVSPAPVNPTGGPVSPTAPPAGLGAAVDQQQLIREVAAQVREALKADLQAMVNAAVANQAATAASATLKPEGR